MGHQYHGDACGGQPLNHVQHFLHHFRVKGRGRLIKQHHFRLHGQGTSNGYPLLLSAGEGAGIHILLFQHAYAVQQFLSLGDCLFLRHFLHGHGGVDHVLHHRFMRKQVEVLEYHADPLADNVGIHKVMLGDFFHQATILRPFLGVEQIFFLQQIFLLDFLNGLHVLLSGSNHGSIGLAAADNVKVQVRIRRGDQLPIHPDFTIGRGLQQVNGAKQGRLTTAGRSDDGNHFPIVHRQAYTA